MPSDIPPSLEMVHLVDAVVAAVLERGDARETIPAVRKQMYRTGHHDAQDAVQPLFLDALGRRLAKKPAKAAEEAAATIPLVASRLSPEDYDWQPIIDSLARQVVRRPIGAASQAATSLGLLLGFRPETPAWTDRMEDHMPGEPGDCEDSRWSPYHIERGTIGESGPVAEGVSVDGALASLLKRLERPLAKDQHRQVSGACARALGWIGYGRPDLAKAAIESLWKSMRQKRVLPTDTLWALTNIGYRHPEWMPERLPELLRRPDLPKLLRSEPMHLERIWRVKVGRHPEAIVEAARAGGIDAAAAVDRLRGFLIGLHLSGSPQVVEAFGHLLDIDTDGTIKAIEAEIQRVSSSSGVPLYFPGSLAGVIENLMETHRMAVEQLAPMLWDVVLDWPDHYWPDTIARIMEDLGSAHVPSEPAALRERLEKAYGQEGRASVSSSLGTLLALIDRAS